MQLRRYWRYHLQRLQKNQEKMANQQIEQYRFQPKLGLIGAVIGVAVGLFYAEEWFEFIVPAAVGFVVGGAAPVFGRIWLYLFAVAAFTVGMSWMLIHYFLT